MAVAMSADVFEIVAAIFMWIGTLFAIVLGLLAVLLLTLWVKTRRKFWWRA